jgi:hypothetical protein
MSKEEEEKKKWHIDRIQTLVASYIQKFESERARFRPRIEIVGMDLQLGRTFLWAEVQVRCL